jgi:DNA repair photolyase
MSNLAIYKPKTKASEYAVYACNFYRGCSNQCDYCFLKKGVWAKTLGGNIPTLKKCFKDEEHAIKVFKNELNANIYELRKHGLLFSFTTDTMLPETISLTEAAARVCLKNGVPVKILTKRTDWVGAFLFELKMDETVWGIEPHRAFDLLAFGFTLTGYDCLEPYASSNIERVMAGRRLHSAGFKTFASIEPIIDFASSYEMVQFSSDYCDLYKIGLKSGGKYKKGDARRFLEKIKALPGTHKIYIKKSLRKLLDIDYPLENLGDNFVGADYDMFEQTTPFVIVNNL